MRIRLLTFLFIVFGSVVNAQDLVFESYAGGALQIERYDKFNQTVVIKNTGIVEVDEPFNSSIILSTDPVINSGDIGIAYMRCTTVINPGSTISLSFSSGNIDVAAGAYYMILQLDYHNEVQETDDLNNFVLDTIEILPTTLDWQIKSISIDSTDAQMRYNDYPDEFYDPIYFPDFPRDTLFHPGEELRPVLNIVNNGAIPISDDWLYVSFFLSSDNVLDDNDPHIGSGRISLEGEMDFTPEFYYYDFFSYPMIPHYIGRGTYRLIAKVDFNNWWGSGDFVETDENNNVAFSSSIVIGDSEIDLTILSAEATFSNDYLSCSYEVRNLGETGAGGYSVTAYLSLDQQIDNEDYVFVKNNYYDQAPPLYRWDWGHGSLFEPSYNYDDVMPGTYYLIVQVDGPQDIDYSNNIYISETANVIVGSGVYTPHLEITGAAISESFSDLDRTFPLTISFKSNESALFNAGVDFQISILDEENVIVKNLTLETYISVNGGSTRSYTWNLEIGSPLELGTYTVQITPQSSRVGPTITTSLHVNVPTYVISGYIVGENNGGDIDKGKLFLYHKPENGKVRFINKTIFTDGNEFSYKVESYPHTLFYIPDRVAYPNYVPTILGKTVALQESNFFTLTHDVDTVFEILHTQPISSGGRAVTGNVYTSSSSGRLAELNEGSVEGFPVILLSSDGTPVRVTTTDAEGNYSFTGLPENVYQVIVALELDQTTMDEPVAADVTEHDVVLNLAIGDTEVTPEVKFGQEISFNEVTTKVFGDEAFDIAVESSSGLPVSITSSDPAVAIIVDGKIEIIGAGTTTITLTQEGNEQYIEESVSYELVVAKADPVISFAALDEKILDDGSFELWASSNSPMSIVFTSDNEAVATVEGTIVTLHSAGEATITASQDGNNNYNASSTTQLLRVNLVTGMNENYRNFKLTPNPVRDFMKVETAGDIVRLELFDSIGKPVAISFEDNVADLRGIASGFYIVKVITLGHQSVVRIVKH
jgi:hypothetical protein